MSDARKLLKRWAQVAQRAGWRVTASGGGHLKWRSPNGATVITGHSPGEGRAMANSRAALRRAGLEI